MKDQNLTMFLKELRELEGGVLHRNKTEENVTTGYGIYFKGNEKTAIYKYISNLGQKLGFDKDTSKWSQDEIKKVNAAIDPEEELKATKEFYSAYFKSLDIENIHRYVVINICSIFVNSRSMGVRVLQKSYNEMIALLSRYRNMVGFEKVAEDGLIGPKTRDAIKKLSKAIKDEDAMCWNSIGAVITCLEYRQLVENKPENRIYLKGWMNRVLENMRDNIKMVIAGEQ